MATKSENMLKQITIILFVMLLLNSCYGPLQEKEFLRKYEFDDFSQFNNVHVFIRGLDGERNPIVMIKAPDAVKDTARVGLYVVTLDKKNYHIIETKWTLSKKYVDADTVKLKRLVQAFIKYKIPRLYVDKKGNVFVYMDDLETLAMARFVRQNETLNYPKKKWTNMKGNWYKPD
jgi:hypothetical protein